MPGHATQWHMPLIMKILAKHFPGQRPKAADGRPKYSCAHLAATCIKFKVFTAMFPLHFAQKLYFARAVWTQQQQFTAFTGDRRQAQTLLRLLVLYEMYCVFQLSFFTFWFGFVWLSQWQLQMLHLLHSVQLTRLLCCFLSLASSLL